MSVMETDEEYKARMKKLGEESKSEDELVHMMNDLQEQIEQLSKEVSRRRIVNNKLDGFTTLINGLENQLCSLRTYFNQIVWRL